MKPKVLFVFLGLALVGAACSSSTDPSAGGSDSGPGMGMPSTGMHGPDESQRFTFGRPGDPANADRTIEVAQLDTFRFQPSAIGVEIGDTVTFVVTNEGQGPHEFVIGDEMFQQEHESEMRDMGGGLMPDEPNAITVQPGGTKSLTWTFTKSGSLQFGCHVSGHFAAGMVGTMNVSA